MTGNDPPQYIVEHDGDYLFVVHVEGIVFLHFRPGPGLSGRDLSGHGFALV